MKKSGFTLIELIFVIVIIGLLAAVAVPKFMSTKKNAETANLPNVGNQIVNKAAEQYNLVQVTNLKYIITHDKDLNRTIHDWNQTPFRDDMNETEFNITYTGGSTHLCLRVNRVTEETNVSPTVQVKTYNFVITDLNKTCNQL